MHNLTLDPADRNKALNLVPLLLLRDNVPMLVPPVATGLRSGDRILFCGTPDARSGLNISVNNAKALTYIVDGIEVPDSLVWRWVKGFLSKQ
jgi:voltage-gated potassium channel